MDKKQMLHSLEARAEEYRLSHPATADTDLKAARMAAQGKSAAQIGMELPCSESTVYRSLRRVEDFLDEQIRQDILEVLQQHIAENPPNYGDWNAQSVIEMLYVAYCEYNRFESAETKSGFDTLYAYLRELPLKKVDNVIDQVCDLAQSHQRDGFAEGLKLGVRLGNELKM